MKKLLLAGVGVAALGFAAPATAADLPARMPVKAPVVVPVYNWTGFYIGGHAGWGWANNDGCLSVTGNIFVGGTACGGGNDMDGFIGGGQVGYNWQMGQWVIGIEADISGSDQKADVAGACGPGCTFGASAGVDVFGTVRARLGLAADRWLFYVTGGLAWTNFEASGFVTTPAGTFAVSGGNDSNVGWTIGAGVEFAAWGNFTIGLEYLYIQTDTDSCNGSCTIPLALGGGTVFIDDRFENNIVRAKLNYRF